MTEKEHHSALENMYRAAPINQLLPPTISVSKGQATITMEAKPDYFHTAGAVHGSIYFKLLDDAAFFAANSLEMDVFVLTTSFTTYLTRPVSKGRLRAEGQVVNQNRTQWIVESVLFDGEGREIARGNGVMMRSKARLKDIPEYQP